MNQHAPSNPNQPVPQQSTQPLAGITRTSGTIEYARARIFLFILLLILNLIFKDDIIFFSLITTVLILLTIPIFGPLFDIALAPLDKTIALLVQPLEHFFRFLFVRHLPSFGRWLKRHRRILIVGVSIVAITSLLATTTLRPVLGQTSSDINDYICLHTDFSWDACNSGYGITALNNINIGLIKDQTGAPFDTSTKNEDERQVENGNGKYDSHHIVFDGIFGENKRACQAPHHVTLIAVTMLSRTVEDPQSGVTIGIQNLQGYYLAQRQYNHPDPDNPKHLPPSPLCLVIANLGTPDTASQPSPSPVLLYKPLNFLQQIPQCNQEKTQLDALPRIMCQIAQLAHTDPTIRGIIGFPYSRQVQEALALRDHYRSLTNIPIISPTASSDDLANKPNFYRVNAPDKIQGQAIAAYFCKHLYNKQSSSSIAILSSSDIYSGDLAQSFRSSLTCVRNTNDYIPYTNRNEKEIRDAIGKAINERDADYIFFPGYDEDLDSVELKVHEILQNKSGNQKTVTILGGDGLNNVNATTHYAYNFVYAASFAQTLPLSDPIIRDFNDAAFSKPSFTEHPKDQIWVPKDTILAIDALQAFTRTMQKTQKVKGIDFAQEYFNTNLQSLNFVGESGEIQFLGDRVNQLHISDREREDVFITLYNDKHSLSCVSRYTTEIVNDLVKDEKDC